MNPSVAFTDVLSEPSAVGPEYVIRSGKIFAVGDYPDKDFSMTPEELAAAVAEFQPCDVDLEHTDTVLSGKLGRVQSVSLADDGQSLHGSVSLPKWLDDALGDTDRKVSATWDRATKTLQGLALVLSPRVPDAALMSAYAAFAARHDTPHGQMAMQELHDTSTRHGAVCAKGNVKMASSHESSAIQKIHDTAIEHGAACSSIKPGASSFPSMYSANPAGTATTSPKEGHAMSWKDRLLAAINGIPEDEGDDSPPPAAVVVARPATATLSADPKDAELARMRQERDAAQAESNRLRVESIRKDAANFADRILKEGRITPAMRAAVIAKFECDALDDASYGTVTFGADGKVSHRSTMLEEIFALAKPDQLSASDLAPALMSVLQGHRETPTQDANREATPDELEKLLKMTAQGQALLSATRGTDTRGHINGRA